MLLQILLKGNLEVQFEGINEYKGLSQKHWHDALKYMQNQLFCAFFFLFLLRFYEGPSVLSCCNR